MHVIDFDIIRYKYKRAAVARDASHRWSFIAIRSCSQIKNLNWRNMWLQREGAWNILIIWRKHWQGRSVGFVDLISSTVLTSLDIGLAPAWF